MNIVLYGILFTFVVITCYSKPLDNGSIDIVVKEPIPRVFRVKRLTGGVFIVSEKHEESHYQKSERTFVMQGNVPIDFTQIFVGGGANNHNFIKFGQ